MGNSKKGAHYPNRKLGGEDKYRHDEETWVEMWRKVGEKIGVKWKVDVWWQKKESTRDASLNEDGAQQMKYSCRMI